ncbi:hypothetical protein CGH58_05830 [Vibrio parahaemolyticus]|uniref:DUF2938 domain-containing protein n=1 Tax=Vibrio parahaemolyticus TaxID=670 RepID=UPI00111EC2F6|nr:DUF2938 domain-containing protein [Vibrio parahaemolyticus]EGQ9055571.1 DUF2938 family protein [Vibrio parahaemolyticus]EHJ9986649.1 DUF2938 domain-containing protein [Vibrio parahaemolyticus]ELA9386960.1 DUF2938 domain-containing protein [Vibrio parahaemolyticus]MCG9541635.1 DUF2938 domain-containing protein [Vibrio parahaemolyticus]MDF4267241.1 DUF2938 domain-containing protein [Vibrio parahaemolyticus]
MLFLIGLQAALIGIGATVIMDLWAWLQRRVFGIPSLNYALVARWVLCMPKGKLVHAPIMSTDPMRGEKALGWFLHYAIGVVFALAHIAVFGHHWLVEPSLTPGLITGAVTLVFPFLVIQPCLGFGFAASKTPTPWKARLLSTLAHLAYGLGLFITAFATKGVSQYFM